MRWPEFMRAAAGRPPGRARRGCGGPKPRLASRHGASEEPRRRRAGARRPGRARGRAPSPSAPSLGDGAAPHAAARGRREQPAAGAGWPASGSWSGWQGPAVPPRAARRRSAPGAVAGVVLFAGSFPSRAAGRRLIARLQAIPRPPHLRDPLLIMVDQEGGQVKRVSGAPSASAREMGARGAAFSRRQGARTARNLRQARDQRRPRAGARRRPARRHDRRHRTRLRLQRGARSRRPRSRSPRALQAGGVAATAQALPRARGGDARTPTSRCSGSASRRRGLRAVDEAPYRRFVGACGDLVMLSTAIYPALSPRPAAFSRAIATGELRGRLGFEGVSITDALRNGRGRSLRRAGEGRRRRGPAPAPTCCSSPTSRAAQKRAPARWSAGCAAAPCDRAEFEASAQRVLDLRRAPRALR